MWARISGNQLVEVIRHPKSLYINDIQYPKSIFSSAWTDSERRDIGVVPFEYSGERVENMFYTSSESSPSVKSDKVVVTRTKNARNVDYIKTTMKNEVNNRLTGYLQQTDWIVIREQETSKAKPSDLAKWRTDLRTKAAELETAINNKTDIAGLEAITVFTEEMRDAGKKASEFDDWPKNPRAS